MKIYDTQIIDEVPWPDTSQGRFARTYLVPQVRGGTSRFFSDLGEVQVVEIDDLLIPIIIGGPGRDNSPGYSIRARYINIPLQAIPRMGWPPAVARSVRGVLSGLGRLLDAAEIETCIYIGNWGILRGMEPMLSPDQARRMTEFMITRFPAHALVFGAVCSATHHLLLNSLMTSGYSFLFAGHTRFLFPYQTCGSRSKRENRRRDARLLRNSGYQVLHGEDIQDHADIEHCAARLAALYKALNRDKYSTNPMVSQEFFALALRERLMSFRMLATKDGCIDGFFGYVIAGDVLCPPLFGYDLSIPRSVGLYRMLFALLVQEAFDHGVTLETGAGADEFKSLRGDLPAPRYGAYFVKHLPRRRQMGWRLLKAHANRAYASTSRKYLQSIDGPLSSDFECIPAAFHPRGQTPRGAAEAVRRDLAALRSELDAVFVLPGELQSERAAALAARLSNWPYSPRLVQDLHQRLALLETRARSSRRKQAERTTSSAINQARRLLDMTETVGTTSLVLGELEDAGAQQLRAAADDLRARSVSAAILLASVHDGTVVVLAVLTGDLVARGIDAGALLQAILPGVGGRGGGQATMAWGGGLHAEKIGEALAAGRAYLTKRLCDPA